MHFAIKSKTAKVNKTLRGRMNFKGRLLKNTIKIDIKLLQNKGGQKTSQKPLQNSIFGAMLASQTLPKSKKNQTKIYIKKKLEKMCKKVPT